MKTKKIYPVQVVKTEYYYIDIEASSKEEAWSIVCDTYFENDQKIEDFLDDEEWEVNVHEALVS